MTNEINVKKFLGNKFSVPTIETSIFFRHDLFKRLNEKKSKQWCSISAPAGFGKTCLVVSWLSKQTRTPIWLTLESGDNQIADFWVAIVTAFAVQGYKTKTYQELTAYIDMEIGGYEWVNQFFKEVCVLAGKKGQAPVLVLDDMHYLNNQTIISSIARLLQFLPSEMSMVLISREMMPKAIKSLNISSTNVEITAQDLAFTNDHCLMLAKSIIHSGTHKASDPHLNASLIEKVSNISHQTDGWPVFVSFEINRLMAGRIETLNDLNLIDQDLIFSYLEQNIFDNLSSDMKKSLIGLAPYSTLNKVFYKSCLNLPIDFDRLIQTNGFFTSANLTTGFMRLRGPLKQFLSRLWEQKKQNTHTKEFVKCYEWYLGHNMIIEALLLSLEHSDWLAAVYLIEKESENLLGSGRFSEVGPQIEIIPEVFFQDRPVFLVFMARYFYQQVKAVQVESYITKAKKYISDDVLNGTPNGKYTYRTKEQLLSDILQLKHLMGGLFNEGSANYTDSKAKITAQCSGDTVTAGLMFGLYALSVGKLTKAQRLLEGVLQQAVTASNHTVLSKSLVALGWVCYLTGDYTKLHVILGFLKNKVSSTDNAMYTIAHQSSWVMALALIEQGNASQAKYILEELELNQKLKNFPSDVKFAALVMQVITKIDLEEFEDAEKVFENLDILSFDLPVSVKQCFYSIPALKAGMYLKQGYLEKAIFWAENIANPDDVKNTVPYQYECLVKADVLFADGHYDKSLSVLFFLKNAALKSGNQIILMKACITQSLVYQFTLKEEQSNTCFQEAIRIGKKIGSVNSFLRDKQQIPHMLKRVKVNFRDTAYIETLLTKLNIAERSHHQYKCQLAVLSQREREVLELMATGISNPEIAQKLNRSLGTIKIHVHNIYKKLGVSNRVTALNKYLSVMSSLNDIEQPQKSMPVESIY
jgi:LuxR family maltose regulon positive regulatory protein